MLQPIDCSTNCNERKYNLEGRWKWRSRYLDLHSAENCPFFTGDVCCATHIGQHKAWHSEFPCNQLVLTRVGSVMLFEPFLLMINRLFQVKCQLQPVFYCRQKPLLGPGWVNVRLELHSAHYTFSIIITIFHTNFDNVSFKAAVSNVILCLLLFIFFTNWGGSFLNFGVLQLASIL